MGTTKRINSIAYKNVIFPSHTPISANKVVIANKVGTKIPKITQEESP